MIPAAFEQENCVLSRPEALTVDQCEPLPVYRGESRDGQPVVISCWKVTKEELEEISRTGRVWLWIWGDTMPPASVGGANPFE